VVLGVSIVPAVTSAGTTFSSPVISTIHDKVESAISSEAKAESAQSRLNKWSVALKDAEQHPWLGQGLGFTYSYFTPGANVFVVTDLTENILLDLWLRTGVIGVLLFLAAVVTSLVTGFAAWRLHPDRMTAVLTLALVAVVVGLLAKGQVESILDNYRLATVLGLSLGMLRSAVTSGGGGLHAMRTQQAFRHYEVV
jgi:O-antigen ligase